MAKSTLLGHPLHPQLISIPLGLAPFSLVLDILHLATRKEDLGKAADYCQLGAFVGGLMAGAAGAVDYFGIPNQSSSKRSARIHALLNISGLLGVGASLLLRRQRQESRSIAPVLINAVCNGGMFISAWYGGHLVYDLGLRVKGRDVLQGQRELKPKHDEELKKFFEMTA